MFQIAILKLKRIDIQVSEDELNDIKGYVDKYPNMIHCRENVYKILAAKRRILVQPLENDYSLCGKSRSVWCAHLVSAGYQMRIKVHPRYDGT